MPAMPQRCGSGQSPDVDFLLSELAPVSGSVELRLGVGHNGFVSPSVEVRLLGPIEVEVDGASVDLGGVRQRLLVARLGLAPGRVVPTSDLLELLWPDEIPDSAVANLQSYVSRVRGRIGRDLIVKDPGGYRLALDRDKVDATRVEDDLTKAIQLEPPERLEVLDAARRSWRGASLADVVDWLGLVPNAARLDDLRLRVLELWAESVLANGHYDICLTVLPPFMAQHPAREGLHLAFMRALAATGRVDEALRVANELRTAVAEATGLGVGDRVAELERQLLAEPDGHGKVPRPEPTPRPPSNAFVGRQADITALVDLAGRPGVVEIIGPAGVGKTRLVLELLSKAPWPESRPRRFVDLTGCQKDERLQAAVAGKLSIGSVEGDSIETISGALDAGTLLVFDNCEQVAGGTASLIRGVSEIRDDVTIMCTSRRRLGVDSIVHELVPLANAEALMLFEDRARTHRRDFSVPPGSEVQVDAIVAAADGLPLALELLGARERVLGIDELARQVRLAGSGPPVDDLLPELLASLEGSYGLLSADARALFRRLSVVPGSFGLGVVEALDDHPVTNIGELIDACLVTVDHGADVRYRLLHPVRSIGLHHLGRGERAEACTLVSDWVLESMRAMRRAQDDRQPGPTVFLRREGAIIDSCIDWLLEASRSDDAARLAVDVSLIVTDAPSIEWLARLGMLADRAVQQGDDDGEAAGLWILAGASAACIGGDVERCHRLLDGAESRLGDDHPFGWYMDFVGAMVAVYCADPESGEDCARAVLSDQRAPPFVQATSVCVAALARHYAGQHRRAEELLALAPDVLTEIGRIDGFVDFTRAELCASTDPDRAVALLGHARELCAVAGHTFNHRVASIAQLALEVRRLNIDRAGDLATEVVADCCRSGMWAQAWIVARLTAELLVSKGRYLEAEVLYRLADADSSAPKVLGHDATRLTELRIEIESKLTDDDRRTVDRLVTTFDRSELPDVLAGALAG